MNKVTELYYKSCLELGLKPQPIAEINGFKVTIGHKVYYFRNGHIPLNDGASSMIGFNKYGANALWRQNGIPVVRAITLERKVYEQGTWSLEDLKFPLVIKPGEGTSCGLNVICGIKTQEKLTQCLDKYFQKHNVMNIEEYVPNLKSYRVLVLFNKVIGVVERTPAHVIGDGRKSLNTLIDERNKQRAHDKFVEGNPTGAIRLNEETDYILEEKGVDLNYIPKQDEIFPLRYVCNSAQGGTYASLPLASICKENACIAVKAAKVLNLNLVGLDMLCEDIEIPLSDSKGFILEANVNPDVRIHEKAKEGVPYQVTKDIIQKHISRHPIYRLKAFTKRHLAKAVIGLCTLDILWHMGLYFF